MQQRIRFTCAFPEMLSTLIHKDVGQIPYHLARELGWNCDLVYWARTNHAVHEPDDFCRWVRRVPLVVTDSRARKNWAFLRHLTRNARTIDVLLLYHMTSDSLLFAILYKALNPDGVAVLKLDMDHRGLVFFDRTADTTRSRALRRILAATPLDFLTTETESMRRRLAEALEVLGQELQVFPIGVEAEAPKDPDALFAAKENIVLTAGRLGLKQKNNELLLDAIERLNPRELGTWRFWLVGSRTPDFDARIEEFKRRRPDLREYLVIRDFVASRKELAEIYGRAKVYCLTSRWESFAIVLAEAAYHGCYLLSTAVGAAMDLTQNGENGTLMPESVEVLAEALRRIFSGDLPIEAPARSVLHHVRTSYEWPTVIGGFAELVHRHRQLA